MNYLYQPLTDKIIRAYYNVYNKLGYGFLERVYEKSMMYELKKMGLHCIKQHPISVFYYEEDVGDYFADILVEDKVIIELKAAIRLKKKHEAQLLNYLKATNMEIGLLINFGSKPKIKRKIFENKYK